MTAYDELELDTLGDKKIALFIISDTDATLALSYRHKSQLKALYKDNSDTIIGNCDSMIFLGGKEKATLKDLTETLGKAQVGVNQSVLHTLQNHHCFTAIKTVFDF